MKKRVVLRNIDFNRPLYMEFLLTSQGIDTNKPITMKYDSESGDLTVWQETECLPFQRIAG